MMMLLMKIELETESVFGWGLTGIMQLPVGAECRGRRSIEQIEYVWAAPLLGVRVPEA